MIPTYDVTPVVPSPLPACDMPKHDDISEEGFGGFRGTWFIGRAHMRGAEETLRRETEVLDWLDRVSRDADMFEKLALAIENQDADVFSDDAVTQDVRDGLNELAVPPSEFDPLGGLEVGVAGLSVALSAVGCLTAASCRSHATENSWSDCPVVFFSAHAWRVEQFAGLIAAQDCGLDSDRGMLTIYGASVRDTHRLAEQILADRARIWRRPEHLRRFRAPRQGFTQMELGDS
jgi:hypothetical protein